ncbi:hypothetical protein D9M68_638000 [compost metagenome]
MMIQRDKKTSLSNHSQCHTKSAEDKNLSASASSRNPKHTFTLFNQPPDLGILFRKPGKIADKVKGSAKAKAKPNIPIAGARISPLELAWTNKVPIIGPVQEKDTKAKDAAIKKIPPRPLLLSALESILLTNEAGRVISKAPKKEMAKTTNSRKKRMLNTPLLLNSFNLDEPNSKVISRPTAT